ncbi:MAG: flagellar hook capping protein [Micrococcales bacterium]|nr:flagellar hook capping protein [Micrococcales bacterium]
MPDISVSSITSQNNVAPTMTEARNKNIMDSDGFLKLLIAQLANQDPSSPMDTQQMMAQTTQLSMMEQLVSMATDSRLGLAIQQRTLASQLVGAEVTFATPDGANATGVVEKVIYTVGEPTLVIGGQNISLSSVAAVNRPASPSQPDPEPTPDGSQTP